MRWPELVCGRPQGRDHGAMLTLRNLVSYQASLPCEACEPGGSSAMLRVHKMRKRGCRSARFTCNKHQPLAVVDVGPSSFARRCRE